MVLLELLSYNDIVCLVVFFSCLFWMHRWFLMTSGEAKTNVPFIYKWDIISGSRDSVFENGKLMAQNAEDRHNELGDTYGCYWGDRMQIFTRDPDLIFKVSVTDFHKHPNRSSGSLSKYLALSLLEAPEREWRKSRRAIGQVLKPSRLKSDNVEDDIEDSLGSMISFMTDRIEKTDDKSKIFEIHSVLKNFVLKTILRVLFDTTGLIDFHKENNEITTDWDNFMRHNYDWIVRVCFLIPPLAALVKPFLGLIDHGQLANKLTSRLVDIAARVEAEKKNNVQISGKGNRTTIHSLAESKLRGELTKDQMVANAFFLMFASFATTADTIMATLYMLAKNQDEQMKLRKELLKYGEESQYLEQVINETMRLYPGSMTCRQLSEHVYWKNHRIVKGVHLHFSIYSVHRDPKLWGEDAHEWKPERFDPSKRATFHPAQFLPFGVGQRNCVGSHFARLEISKVIAQLVTKFQFDLCSTSPRQLSFMPIGALPWAIPLQGPCHLRVSLAAY